MNHVSRLDFCYIICLPVSGHRLAGGKEKLGRQTSRGDRSDRTLKFRPFANSGSDSDKKGQNRRLRLRNTVWCLDRKLRNSNL